MKWLVDANLPYSTQHLLAPYGESWHVRDVGLSAAPDPEVFAFAQQKKAVLVTRDLEFGNPHLFPPASHQGVIIVRVPTYFTAADINDTVQLALPKLPPKLKETVVVIEPGRMRIKGRSS